MPTPRFLRQFIPVSLALLLAACGARPDASTQIEIEVVADGRTRAEMVSGGSSVRAALEEAGFELGPLDSVEPSLSVELFAGDQVTVIRVEEQFETEQDVLPFSSRTLRNESLPEGEERLIQAGAAGSLEITYRLLYEDGELVSRTNVGSHVVAAPVDEIIMVGVQAPASSVAIQGRLAYVSAGNAWLIEGASGQRRAIVTSGDLDGRILRISPDGQWLLFTRAGDGEELINTLWVASLAEGNDLQLSLRAENIVHFADFVPGADGPTVAYSTAEVAAGPPGWQATNDLFTVRFSEAGTVSQASQLLAPRTDSLYTWWGSYYAWSPDGSQLAFARPDALGLVDLDDGDLDILQVVLAFQTESEWAWMPTVAWSPDSSRLYYTNHVEQPGLEQQARSPLFDLVAMEASSGALSTLANNVGMFAQPQPSPTVEGASYLAFLQAINPSQSDVSAYQLAIIEASGEPATILFPPSGAAGLSPGPFSWSPAPEGADSSLYVALVYQGNLWLVDVFNGATTQLTADSLVSAVVWGD